MDAGTLELVELESTLLDGELSCAKCVAVAEWRTICRACSKAINCCSECIADARSCGGWWDCGACSFSAPTFDGLVRVIAI